MPQTETVNTIREEVGEAPPDRSTGWLRWLPLLCVAVYLLVSLTLVERVIHHSDGHLVYALDDPYIHLALAEQLAHGHYGINPGEWSSPSSSLLWPFLLIPFAGTRWHVYVPLAWNLLFGAATAWLIGSMVGRWSGLNGGRGLLSGGRRAIAKCVITAMVLLVAGNLFTLTLIGMEHVLQVLLAAICAYGISEALSKRPIGSGVLVAAVLLPSVRYEGLALTLAVAVALYGQRRRVGPSLLLLGVSLVPLLGFSLVLHQHGLPWLPNSVMVKSKLAGAQQSVLERGVALVEGNLLAATDNLEYWPPIFLCVLLLHRAWQERDRARRFALAGAGAALLLQVAIGSNGWFTRYEVYAVLFGLLVLTRVLAEGKPMWFGYFAMGLIFCASPYVRSTQQVVQAAEDVYHQQFQMHRFLDGFYRGSVAVNDIGLVSFARPKGMYVLDLWGLATNEAAGRRVKDAGWLEGLTTRHQTDLAMIYPWWFASIPPEWTPLGTLCMAEKPVVMTGRCVTFYSTRSEAVGRLREAVAAFQASLPATVTFTPGTAGEPPLPRHPPS